MRIAGLTALAQLSSDCPASFLRIGYRCAPIEPAGESGNETGLAVYAETARAESLIEAGGPDHQAVQLTEFSGNPQIGVVPGVAQAGADIVLSEYQPAEFLGPTGTIEDELDRYTLGGKVFGANELPQSPQRPPGVELLGPRVPEMPSARPITELPYQGFERGTGLGEPILGSPVGVGDPGYQPDALQSA